MDLLLVYDDECWLCRSLAQFVHKAFWGKLRLLGWSQYSQAEVSVELESILLIEDGVVYKGPKAWSNLISRHPQLKAMGWIAEKLKLQEAIASSLDSSAKSLRRRCKRC